MRITCEKEVQEQIIRQSEMYAKEMLTKGAIAIDTDRPIGEVGGGDSALMSAVH